MLLRTKLYIPPPRPNLVVRPRLIQRLDKSTSQNPAGFVRKLTLISSPAGSGKTTLLSTWASSASVPVAWLSLDSGDNDPVRFLTYVIAALQTIEPGLGAGVLATLQSPGIVKAGGVAAGEALLTALLNDISTVHSPFVLVLDDYHLIQSEPVHNATAFVVDHMPPQMHLVVSTRVDPSLSLSRLRGRSELTEIRTRDLRFSIEEATEFLNACLDLDLSSEDIATLEARTEGWVVGLQMAGLSMQEQSPSGQHQFVTAFAGDDRYVVDYLMEEVLRSQPEALQAFLLETAILERLSAPLCDAVRLGQGGVGATPPEDSQAILERLEQANLFLVPLDAKRQWYRYHQLFSDLLRFRLQQTSPDRMAALHSRASQWYEQNGFLVEAVSHAVAAGDLDRVARLVEVNAWLLLSRGETATLQGWLDALPGELVHERPRLSLVFAWASLAAMRLDAVEPCLRNVEQRLSVAQEVIGPGGVQAEEAQWILGEVAAIRATVAGMRGDGAAAIQLSHEALAYLPVEECRLRGVVSNTLGAEYESRGDAAAASEAFAQAAGLSQAAGSTLIALIALGNLARLQQIQGQLQRSTGTCRRALALAADHGVEATAAAGMAHAGMGRLHYEWDELDAATDCLQRASDLGRQAGIMELVLAGSVTLARVRQARGEIAAALDLLGDIVRLAQEYHVTAAALAEVRACHAHLLVTAGDPRAATYLLYDAGLSATDEAAHLRHTEYVALVRVLLAQGTGNRPVYLDEAHGLLARLLSAAEAQERMGHVLELLTLQALALQEQDAADEAIAVLARALALGEPEGYIRIFVDAGASMRELLRRAGSLGTARGYVDRLLTHFDAWPGDLTRGRERMDLGLPAHPSPLIEPLSEREFEVLRLIAAGHSNREIAEQLVITVGTVKWHINNIYGKLSVRRRTEAVARAQGLGLLH